MSRSKGHAEVHADERWVISYADLVTLLLGFFILLYATADANQMKLERLSRGLSQAFNVPLKEAASGGSLLDGGSGFIPAGAHANIDADLQAIQRLVKEKSEAAGLTGKILVSRDEDKIVIRLADNLLFPSASADMREGAKPLLAIVADALKQTPNEVRVEGHTDNIPLATDRYPSNWELSSARATAVLRFLVNDLNVEPKRLFSAGYAEFRPIASNLAPEGRALNRRADIVILYPQANIGGGPAAKPAAPLEGVR